MKVDKFSRGLTRWIDIEMIVSDNNEVRRALDFARKMHAAQFRKGTDVPYATHLANVGGLLAGAGCDTPVVVAGILHDIVEDTPATLDEVRERFGQEVMELVDAASEQDKRLPWKERKNAYLDALKNARLAHLFIPCADKLDNIAFLNEMLRERGRGYLRSFNAPEPELAWFYLTAAGILADRLGRSNLAGMAAELLEKTETAFNVQKLRTGERE